MKYTVILVGERSYLECQAEGSVLAQERDALDLVSACGEEGTNLVMLHAANLSEDFYNLKTGLAGAVLLKFSTYSIRAAAVIPPELAKQGRFGEMMIETNRGRQFYVCSSRAEAEDWLLNPAFEAR